MKKKVSIVLILCIFLSLSLSPYLPPLSLSISHAASKNFSDVIQNHWFYNDVQQLVELGAISGLPDGTFRPDEPVTRSAFVKILVNALQFDTKPGNYFVDTEYHWAKDNISTAIAEKILYIDDYGRNFHPEQPINRIEMAQMLIRALKIEPIDAQSPFIDINNPYTNTAYSEYLIMGVMKQSIRFFKPYDNATRAEASAIIMRAVDYKADPLKYKKTKKEQEVKAIQEQDNSIEVEIENVSSLPDRVKVESIKDFKKKLMTAAYIKKDLIIFEVADFDVFDYSYTAISNYINAVNFAECFNKGYAANFDFDDLNIKLNNDNTADISIKLTYDDLEHYGITNLKEVRDAEHIYEVIKTSILNKEETLSLAQKDIYRVRDDIFSIIINISKYIANDEKVLTKGYYAETEIKDFLTIPSGVIVNIKLVYNDF